MLVAKWNREGAEEHRPDEDVVHAERLLDEVPADVLAERRVAVDERDDRAESQPACHPDRGFDGRFSGRRRMRVSVAVEVDRQEHGDDCTKSDPGGE